MVGPYVGFPDVAEYRERGTLYDVRYLRIMVSRADAILLQNYVGHDPSVVVAT